MIGPAGDRPFDGDQPTQQAHVPRRAMVCRKNLHLRASRNVKVLKSLAGTPLAWFCCLHTFVACFTFITCVTFLARFALFLFQGGTPIKGYDI
jgi:hypothetical protein